MDPKCNHRGPYKRETRSEMVGGDVRTGAETGVMGSAPRNAGSNSWKRQGMDAPLELLERTSSADTLILHLMTYCTLLVPLEL